MNRPLNQGDDFSFPAMDKIIKENGWICPIKPVYGDNAYYSISKNEIVIPEKRQFKDGESFYTNLGHEMAHSTGSENHLGRLKPASFGSAEYAREELVAELSAALVAQFRYDQALEGRQCQLSEKLVGQFEGIARVYQDYAYRCKEGFSHDQPAY